MEKLRILEELAEEIRGCPKCRLAETRIHAVPGEGSATARIMFVGEGPGENEDKTGRPFVGQAGKVLNRMLEQAGIAREDVFISNIVKCRPPGNRVPLVDEVETCSDYLMAQIAVIEPKFVIPLGGSALKTLLGPQLKITQSRCKVFRRSGILYIPLYHPAAVLHNPKLADSLQADIVTLRELLNRDLREDEITDLNATQKKAPEKTASTRAGTKRAANKDAPSQEPADGGDGTLSLF